MAEVALLLTRVHGNKPKKKDVQQYIQLKEPKYRDEFGIIENGLTRDRKKMCILPMIDRDTVRPNRDRAFKNWQDAWQTEQMKPAFIYRKYPLPHKGIMC